MPIYRYNEGEHGGGFIGLRVAVMVDSEPKQKHFSFVADGTPIPLSEEQRLKGIAKELNESWMHQQKSAIEKRHNQAKEQVFSIYSTGVRGIRMKFIVEKKIRAGELRTYYTPVFIVSGSNNNKKFSKSFNILTHGYTSAWVSAVLCYAINKNLTDPNNLLDRIPPVEKFMIIIKSMHKTGHKIPRRRFPVELWNNSQVRTALGNMA